MFRTASKFPDHSQSRCGALALARGILTLAFAVTLFAQPPSKLISIQTSDGMAPPGGWAQIKIGLRAPALVQSGSVSLDLDPAIFGDIAAVAVFSATGDALGYANVQG